VAQSTVVEKEIVKVTMKRTMAHFFSRGHSRNKDALGGEASQIFVVEIYKIVEFSFVILLLYQSIINICFHNILYIRGPCEVTGRGDRYPDRKLPPNCRMIESFPRARKATTSSSAPQKKKCKGRCVWSRDVNGSFKFRLNKKVIDVPTTNACRRWENDRNSNYAIMAIGCGIDLMTIESGLLRAV
jgi:hypothetical protein